MKKDIRYIGLTGTNGAGKGEAAAFFVEKGFASFSLSDLLRRELEVRGMEVSRDNLIKLGNGLREKFGADVLARRVMERIRREAEKAVIDSIRNPEEVEYLRGQGSFILVAVDAPAEVRYERVKKRGRNESASNLREFMAKEAEEMQDRETGQQLHKCLKMADATVINDGTLAEFRRKLEALL